MHVAAVCQSWRRSGQKDQFPEYITILALTVNNTWVWGTTYQLQELKLYISTNSVSGPIQLQWYVTML